MTAILDVALSVGYDPIVIARDIQLRVGAGEVCAVIGPNGAGKSTLLSTIAGLIPPISGDVVVDSNRLPHGSARAANAAGITLVPDHRALFTKLTTLENLRVADRTRGEAIEEVLSLFPALGRKTALAAGKLSGGEQQMLALARALVQRPRILLIDEMSMGLAPLVVESLVETVRGHAQNSGAAVVLVEQHVSVALHAADHALVLVHGNVMLQGPADEVGAHPDLQSVYLGEPRTERSELGG